MPMTGRDIDRRTLVKGASLAAALSLELVSATQVHADDDADKEMHGPGTSPSPHIPPSTPPDKPVRTTTHTRPPSGCSSRQDLLT